MKMELIRRILITLLILIGIRILLPFLNSLNLSSLFHSGIPTSSAVAILPFFSSCIFIQILSIFIPALRKHHFGEQDGRRNIVKLTFILTILISIPAGAFYLKLRPMGMMEISQWFGYLQVGLIFSIFVVFILGIANIISRYGIGNGYALLFILIIPEDIYYGILDLVEAGPYIGDSIGIGIYFIIFGIFIWLVYKFTKRTKIIQTPDHTNSVKINIPIKITWLGREPLLLAGVLSLLPLSLNAVMSGPVSPEPSGLEILGNLTTMGWTAVLFEITFILIFSYLYHKIIFKSEHVNDLLRRYDFSQVNLNQPIRRNVLFTASFLFIVGNIPLILIKYFGIPVSAGMLLGGTIGVLLLVGVVYDLIRQFKFYREKSNPVTNHWVVFYIAFDEIEAEIKKKHLELKGIPALIEPLCFTWGMPIRTAVDQYRIYTPKDHVDRAASSL